VLMCYKLYVAEIWRCAVKNKPLNRVHTGWPKM